MIAFVRLFARSAHPMAGSTTARPGFCFLIFLWKGLFVVFSPFVACADYLINRLSGAWAMLVFTSCHAAV